MKDFKNKVAVVTGGTSGIGRAIANRCLDEGMKVVIAGLDDHVLGRIKEEMTQKGKPVLALKVDVSKLDQVEDLARRTVDTFGTVDLLFNNAGVGGGDTIWETTINDWKWIINVNLWGVIHGIKVFVPIMLEQKSEGHIVNTSSAAGLLAGPGMGTYKVTKHAVVSLSETLYYELAVRKSLIGVSVLCPAFVKTKIMLAERDRPAELENPPDSPPLSQDALAQIESTGKAVATGMLPEEVSNKVFDAIKEQRFYILTHPEINPYIKARVEDIVTGANPRM